MKLLKYILNFNHRRTKNLEKTGQNLSTLIKCHPLSNGRCMYGYKLRYCLDKPFKQRVDTSPLRTASCTLEQLARIDEFDRLSWITVQVVRLFKIERQTIKYKLCLPQFKISVFFSTKIIKSNTVILKRKKSTYLLISFKSNRNQKNVFVYKKHEYQLFLADLGIRTHKVEDIIFVGSLSDALPVPRKK